MIDQLALFFFSKELVRTLSSNKLKYHTFSTVKRHIPISAISVVLNYEQLCRAPTSINDGIFL